MNFKEQLSKHENILNEFKAKYINKDNKKENTFNNTSINNSSLNISDINLNNNTYCYPPNNNNSYNYQEINNMNNIQEAKEPQNQNNNLVNDEKNINLEKIDNLLAKLNFKRENNLYKPNISINNINSINNNIQDKKSMFIINEEKNNIQNNSKTNINNNSKLDIDGIKAKYQNNNINSFNITEKFFNDKNEKEIINNHENKLNTINNIKKLNQLNARNEIERIKSKYYSMNLNKKNNANNFLDNNYLINNNIISESYVQLNKEIIDLKTKID